MINGEKQSKLLLTINFSSKIRFEKMNIHWEDIEEEKTYILPEF
jgi:hypothetical protein